MPRQYERPIVTEEEAVYASPRVIPRLKPTPIPEPSIFDEPTYCIKINKSWMAHLSGVVAALDQPDTWIGTEDEIFNTRNMIREWLIAIYNGSMCQPGMSCHDLQLSNPNIVFFPQDPFTQPDYIPPGYTSTPFDVIDNEDLASVGLHTGDVVMFFDSAPNIEAILDTGLPSITVHVEGKVEVELHLLNVPQGGLGFITVDDDPLKTYVITMQSMSVTELSTIIDILESLIGDIPAVELFAETIQEFTFDTDGPHKIEVRLMPFVEIGDETIVNLGIGGGIRKVTVCTMSDPDCCDDSLDMLVNIAATLKDIKSLLKGGMTARIEFNGDVKTPDEAGGDCAPDHFDHDGDDETSEELERRNKALCLTVNQYVKAVLIKVLRDMNAPQSLIDFVDSKFPDVVVPLSLTGLIVVYPAIGLELGTFFDALTDNIDISEIACAMFENLTGDKNNTFSNFSSSLAAVELAGTLDAFGKLVNATNGVKQNYKDFNTTLNANNTAAVDDYECPCGDELPTDCSDPLVLVDFNSHGTVIESMGSDIYKISIPTPGGDGRYVFGVKDQFDRFMKWEVTGDDTTYPPHAVEISDVHGACGTSDYTGSGGFAVPGTYKDVSCSLFFDAPSVTYYKITCVPDDCP